jgi:hypothetical protein
MQGPAAGNESGKGAAILELPQSDKTGSDGGICERVALILP